MSSQQVTMKDIASQLGVSISTVSLALRDSPLVAKPTVDEVQRTAKSMGYKVNPLVSALMQSRRTRSETNLRPSLGLITCHVKCDGWKISPTLIAFKAAAESRVRERGYNIETLWYGEDGMTDKRMSDILRSRGIKGILLFPFEDPRARLNLDWKHFSVVALGYSIRGHIFNRVANDHYQSMRTAVKECAALGYKRIGFFDLDHMSKRVDQRWMAGYYVTHYELPSLDFPEVFILPEHNKEALDHWFERERPDVIITSEIDYLRRWADSRGLKVPRDIGLVSLNAPSHNDSQSGVCQNPDILASRAVDLLIDKTSRNETGTVPVPVNYLVEGTWCKGTTVKSEHETR